jgi:hypothetical protein
VQVSSLTGKPVLIITKDGKVTSVKNGVLPEKYVTEWIGG